MTSTTSQANYNFFAQMYNESWGPRYCHHNLPILEKLLLNRLPQKAKILDLCCGTGQLLQQLQNQGYQVTGIDVSESMLHYARENAPGAKLILHDVRSFSLTSTFHSVISTSASLNHLISLEDLTCVFQNIYTALLKNGWFVLDINLEEVYKLSFLNAIDDGEVKDDYAWASHSSYDPETKIGQIKLTVFSLIERSWQRFDTTWLVKGYSQAEVQFALENVGFKDIEIYDAKRDFNSCKIPGKTLFVCHK